MKYPPDPIPANSLFDEAAAQRLAARLTNYWKGRAKFWAEQNEAMTEPRTTPLGVLIPAHKIISWGVRSNLVNGVPPHEEPKRLTP